MTNKLIVDAKTSGIRWRGGLAIGLAAIPIGIYSHLIIVIPAIAAGAIALVLLKAKLIEDRLLVESVSVQGGNAALMLLQSFISAVGPAFRIEAFGYAIAVFVLALYPRCGL